MERRKETIDRAKAIRTIWAQAGSRGWSDEELHVEIEKVGIQCIAHISEMDPYQLGLVLKRLFKLERFVLDTKIVYSIRKLCERENLPWTAVESLIGRIWKNDDSVTSIYHLNHRQAFVLKTRVLQYIADKNKEEEG